HGQELFLRTLEPQLQLARRGGRTVHEGVVERGWRGVWFLGPGGRDLRPGGLRDGGGRTRRPPVPALRLPRGGDQVVAADVRAELEAGGLGPRRQGRRVLVQDVLDPVGQWAERRLRQRLRPERVPVV